MAKGLVLHESLSRHSSEPFTLHILAMDTETQWMLQDMHLANVEVYPLSTFERAMHLSPQKKARTWTEFCWTCAGSFMEYLMPFIGDLTYLDADLMFFSDPKVVFDEIGERSIGITPHRFPAHRKHKEANGVYNVGWVTAKNTDAGRKCIARWAAQCREWCFNREEGSHACGDQKYLDTWPTDYPGEVCAIQNPGVNLAPWNVEQYAIGEGPTVDGKPVVFYHLHEYIDPHHLTKYTLRAEDRAFIYFPYNKAWLSAWERISDVEARAAEERKLAEMEAQRA